MPAGLAGDGKNNGHKSDDCEHLFAWLCGLGNEVE